MYDEVSVTDGNNKKIGDLFFRRGRGNECQEFTYSRNWLKNGFQIDPKLPLIDGVQKAKKCEFGCFADASPDSWGRGLVRKFYQKGSRAENLLFIGKNFFVNK